MPDRVELKNFDRSYLNAVARIDDTTRRLDLEIARPTRWTKGQLDDLNIIVDALRSIIASVGVMAAQVRDD